VLTPLLADPQRTYAEVRARIDAVLGTGVGLSVAEAARLVRGADHAVWALDNLMACLAEDRLHIWDQSFCSGVYDGPRAIDAIAEAAREIDPLVADLLRWTARWPRTRAIALVSVVPLVWETHFEAALGFLHGVAARWNEAVQPLELPAPPPFVRPELAAAARPVRFPSIAVGFTPLGAACEVQCPERQLHREGVFRAAAWAMWRGGADDAALDDFFAEYFDSGADEVDVLARWITIDGDGGDPARREALRQALHPVPPLARWLDIADLPPRFMVRADDSALEHVRSLIADFYAVELPAGEPALPAMRAALRQDPDVLLAHAGSLTGEVGEGLALAVQTGVSLVVVGSSPAADQLADAVAEGGAGVFDRRKPR
jgi:hypothetical protein